MGVLGTPIKLLNEGIGHTVTVELVSGETLRGHLLDVEDCGNCSLKAVTSTDREGKVTHLERVYIRGSTVRLYILPEILAQSLVVKTAMKRKK